MSKDLIEYRNLHNKLFVTSDISFRWIDWWFTTVHCGKVRIYGAFCDDILVGIWGVEPRKLCISDEPINVGRCFAVGIQKDHRQLGLFKALSKFALQSERELGEYEYIVGFPQRGRTVLKGHFSAGWYPVQEIDVYECSNARFLTENSPAFRTFMGPAENSAYLMYKHKKVPGTFYKWQHTRWTYHPQHHYIPIVLAGAAEGYAVLKQYGDWAHIVALEEPEILKLLLSAMSLGSHHGWSKLNMWCADNSPHKAIIIASGFIKTSDAIQMIAYNVNAEKDLKLQVCNIQMGIEEMY